MKLRSILFTLIVLSLFALSACNDAPSETTPLSSTHAVTPPATTPTPTTPSITTPTVITPAVDSFYDASTGAIDLTKFNFQKEFSYDRFYASNGVVLPYRLYLPPTYNEDEEFPVLVYLHGAGSRGTFNNTPLSEASIYFKNAESPAFHSIIVVPQCPENAWWKEDTIDAFAELLDHINATYSTDMSRQYITGASMGGDGTWQMLESYADKVSAAVTVASCGNNSYISEDMHNIPIYIIYDDTDEVIPTSMIEPMYQQLIRAGNKNAVLVKISGQGHQICNTFVNETDISALTWLFTQRREIGTRLGADGISLLENHYGYYEFTGSNGITLPYRLYSPGMTDVPLTQYLHSKAVCGMDNVRHLEEIDVWAPYTAKVHQSVVLVPQCPEGLGWSGEVIDTVVELIANVEETYGIDTSRQHAIGSEMGVIGIWDLALRYPDLLESANLRAGKITPNAKDPNTTYEMSTLPDTMITCLIIDDYTLPFYIPFFEDSESEAPKNVYVNYYSRLWHLSPRQFNTWIYDIYMVRRTETGELIYEWVPPT